MDAVIMGDTMEFLNELLVSDGGMKGDLFQVDDIYEHDYYIPMDREALIQVLLLADAGKREKLFQFLCTALKQREDTEYQVSAGIDGEGKPVYFCYELDMRHLLRVKQELEWRQEGSIFCFSYQRPVLELFFGKEAKYCEIVTGKAMEYLSQ